MLAWVAAVLLGALVPAFVVALVIGKMQLLPVAFAVTLAQVVLLGLPVALIYRAKRWTRLSAVLAGAFLIGAIPNFLTSWSDFPAYLPSVAATGALGAVGGLVFWLTLKVCGRLPPRRETVLSAPGQ